MSALGEPPDDLDRELMHLEAELAKPARFIEPSAAERARMAARRSASQASRKARKLREPGAGSAAEADPWRSASLPSPRHGLAWRLVTVLIVVVILGAAGYGFAQLARSQRAGDLTSAASAPGPSSATVAEPFLGTPAERYADGAAGIVVPPAEPVGGYSAAQVGTAYRTSKQMLVAAHLDPPTLSGAAPQAFARLLLPEQRAQFTSGLDKTGLNSSGDQNSTRTWVTSFAPGTQLAGHVIKVHGVMQASASTRDGSPVLQVHADYLYVYPVERPSQPSTLTRVVERQVVDIDFATYTDPGGALQPWWWQQGSSEAGARCGVNDGYVHPAFPGSPVSKATPTGPPVNPYNQNAPAPAGSVACQRVTGT